MKRIVPIVFFCAAAPALSWLTACEGEPPVNVPENPSGTGSAIAAAPVSGAVSVEPPSGMAPMMGAMPGQPMAPPCDASSPCGPASGSAAPVGSAGATPEASASAAAAAPPDVARGNLVGGVTTKPPNVAANAVVYLEDAPAEDAPGKLQTVTIDNRQMNFIPYVAVVAVGGKVVFANTDPFPHNVFSPDNDKFNMGTIPQNGAHVRVFQHPGAYSLLCNLHPGMLGYLVVTPTTHFAKTDAKGKFAIKHIPVGTYKVTAWAPRQTPATQSVTVADGDVTVNFDLHR